MPKKIRSQLAVTMHAILVGALVGLAMAYVEIGEFEPPKALSESAGPRGAGDAAIANEDSAAAKRAFERALAITPANALAPADSGLRPI